MTHATKRSASPQRDDSVKTLGELDARLGKRCDGLGKTLAAVRSEVHQIAIRLEPLIDHVAFLEREFLERGLPKERTNRRRPRSRPRRHS